MLTFDLFKTPFMRCWTETLEENGNLVVYPKIRTGEGACILPYRIVADNTIEVLLLEQARPEADGGTFLKTVGGYNRERTDQVCMRENAAHKLGVALPENLVLLREMSHFPVAQVPINLYVCEGWKEISEPPQGCARSIMTLKTATNLAVEGKLFDAATVENVMLFSIMKLFPA